MSSDSRLKRLEQEFRPEVRVSGDELVQSKAVFLKLGSDRSIDALIRASTPQTVAFRSTAIGAASFAADCSCKSSKSGKLCKHIWATLVAAIEKTPDFFDSKSEIEKVESLVAAKMTAKIQRSSETQIAAAAQMKQRQSDYRKEMYQKQKARAKGLKQNEVGGSQPSSKSARALPESVRAALSYFEINGFNLSVPVDQTALGEAKRVLSRVFHPDKGGSRDEILELLQNAEILAKHQ